MEFVTSRSRMCLLQDERINHQVRAVELGAMSGPWPTTRLPLFENDSKSIASIGYPRLFQFVLYLLFACFILPFYHLHDLSLVQKLGSY